MPSKDLPDNLSILEAECESRPNCFASIPR
jgi:hypothetical protein